MIVDLSSHLATRTAKWGALQNTRRSFFISSRSSLAHPANYFLICYPTKNSYAPIPGLVPVESCSPSLNSTSKKKSERSNPGAGREYSNRGQVSNDPISISRDARVAISAFWTTTTRPGKHVLAPTAVFSRSRSAVLADLPRVRLVLYSLHRGESLARMVRISSGLP